MEMHGKLLGITAFALTAGALGMPALNAQSERDIEFAKKLNDLKMNDLTIQHLNRCIQKQPQDVDNLRVQLAETYLLTGKVADAQRIINALRPGSEAYYLGQGTVGIYLFQVRKQKEALPVLEKVFDYCKKQGKGSMKTFEMPLNALLAIYKNDGETAKAKAVRDWILEAANADSGPVDPREKLYTDISFLLDNAETQKEKEAALPSSDKAALNKTRSARMDQFKKRAKLKKADIEALRKADNDDWHSVAISSILKLEDIQWGGQDVITAFSSAATAQCYCMLGMYDEAIKEVARNKDLYQGCDDAYEQGKDLKSSPTALAKYWEARAYYGKYEQLTRAGNTDAAVKALKGAAVSLGRVLKKYEGFRLAKQAYKQFNEAADELVKVSPSSERAVAKLRDAVPVPQGASGSEDEDLISPEIRQKFEDKKYADIIEPLLQLAVGNRSSKALPPVLNMLVMCQLAEGQVLQAQTLSAYLATVFPDSEYTPVTLLRAGLNFWPNGEKDPAKKDIAIVFFHQFLKSNITHKDAGAISLKVAQEYYNRAVALAKEANSLTGDAKKEKIQEAFAMFDKCIPEFEFIIKNFGNNKAFVDAAYLLMATALNSREKYLESAKVYRDFCAQKPESMSNLAAAKLSISDNLYKAGLEIEKTAKDLKEAALSMPVAEKTEAKEGEEAKPADASANTSTREGKLAEADKLFKQAKQYYLESIDNTTEMIEKWLAKDGCLAEALKKDEKVQKAKGDAVHLRAWLYDAAEEKENAIKEFAAFIREYPENTKAVPKCMMRMGVLYTELGKDQEAEKILTRLSNEFSSTQEGKNANFYLARALYNNGSFIKSIALLDKILNDSELRGNLNTQNFRWIASNLLNCGGEHPENAAKVALNASEILLKQLNNPVYPDWIGKDRTAQLKSDEKELTRLMRNIKEKILLDLGTAAYYAKDYKRAVEAYDEIEKMDDNSPYYSELMFGRADAKTKLGNYDSARDDLSKVSLRGNTLMLFSLYNKAQCYLGEVDIIEAKAESDLSKQKRKYENAYAKFNIVAAPAFMNADDPDARRYPNEEAKAAAEKDAEASKEWIETAIYKTAYVSAILNKQQDKQDMQAKYLKHFPKGRFIREINALPGPVSFPQESVGESK